MRKLTKPEPSEGRRARARDHSFGCGNWLCIVLLVFFSPCLLAEERVAERDLSQPVVFAVQDAFPPYSFVGEKNTPSGFTVDLVEALSREMGLSVSWRVVSAEEMDQVVQAGRADAVALLAETKNRHAVLDFSAPVLRFESVVVVRKADGRIKGVGDLAGCRIGVGQKGSVAESFVREQVPGAVTLYAPTKEVQLRLLDEGGCDAVVVSRFTALAAIDQLRLKNVRILTALKGYDVRYCLAVKRGDALLLARFNEGLMILQRNSSFDEIYQKWFGRFEKRSLTPVQIVSYVAIGLALICVGATWGFFRQRSLASRIEKQAAELAEQRSLLAALYDKHPMATVVLDIPLQGPAVFVSMNREAVLILGREKSEVLGRPLDQLALSKELRDHFDDVVARCRAASGPERWETQLPVSRRMLEVATMPLGTHGGHNRVCVIGADITKRRLMDQEIARSRRLRALGELVGGIAHEFNNLLTPILAMASLLRSAHQPAVVTPEELDIIDQAALRAADLTKRLLAFGRKTDDPLRSVQMSEAVFNCEALLKTMIDRRIEWQNDLPRELPPVAFNPTDLNQIVFNLVLNARDTLLEKLGKTSDPAWKPLLRVSVCQLPSGEKPPRIGAGAHDVTGWQRLSVADNGMGIPHDVVDRIFEPFYTTKAVGKGTGLGLSMVWHQVTDAGGDIEVDTKPGEGTTFHVYLPCREPVAVSAPVRQVSPAGEVPKKARILVAEDEPLIASTAAKILERMGHTVSRQADGLKAWEALQVGSEQYDLLLLDLSMPHLSGVDLVKRIRTLPYHGAIMVMSGRVADDDLRALKELRVDRLLPKPFTTEQLMGSVTEILAAKKA